MMKLEGMAVRDSRGEGGVEPIPIPSSPSHISQIIDIFIAMNCLNFYLRARVDWCFRSMGMKGLSIFLEKLTKNKVTSMSFFSAEVFINTILKTWQKV
jgi:hypothetical protein